MASQSCTVPPVVKIKTTDNTGYVIETVNHSTMGPGGCVRVTTREIWKLTATTLSGGEIIANVEPQKSKSDVKSIGIGLDLAKEWPVQFGASKQVACSASDPQTLSNDLKSIKIIKPDYLNKETRDMQTEPCFKTNISKKIDGESQTRIMETFLNEEDNSKNNHSKCRLHSTATMPPDRRPRNSEQKKSSHDVSCQATEKEKDNICFTCKGKSYSGKNISSQTDVPERRSSCLVCKFIRGKNESDILSSCEKEDNVKIINKNISNEEIDNLRNERKMTNNENLNMSIIRDNRYLQRNTKQNGCQQKKVIIDDLVETKNESRKPCCKSSSKNRIYYTDSKNSLETSGSSSESGTEYIDKKNKNSNCSLHSKYVKSYRRVRPTDSTGKLHISTKTSDNSDKSSEEIIFKNNCKSLNRQYSETCRPKKYVKESDKNLSNSSKSKDTDFSNKGTSKPNHLYHFYDSDDDYEYSCIDLDVSSADIIIDSINESNVKNDEYSKKNCDGIDFTFFNRSGLYGLTTSESGMSSCSDKDDYYRSDSYEDSRRAKSTKQHRSAEIKGNHKPSEPSLSSDNLTSRNRCKLCSARINDPSISSKSSHNTKIISSKSSQNENMQLDSSTDLHYPKSGKQSKCSCKSKTDLLSNLTSNTKNSINSKEQGTISDFKDNYIPSDASIDANYLNTSKKCKIKCCSEMSISSHNPGVCLLLNDPTNTTASQNKGTHQISQTKPFSTLPDKQHAEKDYGPDDSCNKNLSIPSTRKTECKECKSRLDEKICSKVSGSTDMKKNYPCQCQSSRIEEHISKTELTSKNKCVKCQLSSDTKIANKPSERVIKDDTKYNTCSSKSSQKQQNDKPNPSRKYDTDDSDRSTQSSPKNLCRLCHQSRQSAVKQRRNSGTTMRADMKNAKCQWSQTEVPQQKDQCVQCRPEMERCVKFPSEKDQYLEYEPENDQYMQYTLEKDQCFQSQQRWPNRVQILFEPDISCIKLSGNDETEENIEEPSLKTSIKNFVTRYLWGDPLTKESCTQVDKDLFKGENNLEASRNNNNNQYPQINKCPCSKNRYKTNHPSYSETSQQTSNPCCDEEPIKTTCFKEESQQTDKNDSGMKKGRIKDSSTQMDNEDSFFKKHCLQEKYAQTDDSAQYQINSDSSNQSLTEYDRKVTKIPRNPSDHDYYTETDQKIGRNVSSLNTQNSDRAVKPKVKILGFHEFEETFEDANDEEVKTGRELYFNTAEERHVHEDEEAFQRYGAEKVPSPTDIAKKSELQPSTHEMPEIVDDDNQSLKSDDSRDFSRSMSSLKNDDKDVNETPENYPPNNDGKSRLGDQHRRSNRELRWNDKPFYLDADKSQEEKRETLPESNSFDNSAPVPTSSSNDRSIPLPESSSTESQSTVNENPSETGLKGKKIRKKGSFRFKPSEKE